MMKRVISEKYIIDGIPVITFYEENEKNLPLVFLVHGFESKKEIHTDMAWNLAEKGFYAVVVDAKKHGERKDSEFANLNYEDKVSEFIEIVYSTTSDIKRLIKYFSSKNNVNINKIGISGNSMGGILSCFAGSVLDEISTIVCAIGSPSWIDLGNYMKHTNTTYKNILNYDESFLIENDPEKNVKRFKGKNLFLLAGEYDDLIPAVFSQRFYEKLLDENVLNNSQLKFHIYPVDHRVSPIMKEDIYNWFIEKLM